MRLLFLVKRVSRICVCFHRIQDINTVIHYRYVVGGEKEKKVKQFSLSKLYRTHNTPHLYLTKITPQKARVFVKEKHTLYCIPKRGTIQNIGLFITSKPFLSYF